LISINSTFSYSKSADLDTEAKIRAAFIYNFTKYISWPKDAYSTKFRIGVLNNEELTAALESMAKVKRVNDAYFEIVRMTDLSDIKSFQMVYINDYTRFPIETIYKKIGYESVLVISDQYPNDECMINFIEIDNRMKFKLNEDEIKKQNITVSNSLLKIGTQTYSKFDISREESSSNTKTKIPTSEVNKKVKNEAAVEMSNEEYDKLVAKLESDLTLEMSKVSKKDQEITSLRENINEQKEELVIVQDKIKNQSNELIKLSSSIGMKEQEYLENIEKVEQSQASLDSAKTNLLKTKNQLSSTALLLDNQKSINYIILVVLLIIGSLGFLSFRSYRKQKAQATIILEQKQVAEIQRDEIQNQHYQLEEKTKEITDSINYAKRIQEAILPPIKLVKNYLAESFIFYQPKDIVAGDFYWMETTDDLVIFAAADCTGHGVPGALVSVVCSNALNQALKEFGQTQPAAILDKTLDIVIERFEKSEKEVKDGMDIALCAYNSKTMELQFAGAQNSLWIIKNGADELIEIKGDKQPIGKYAEKKPFTNHTIQLEKGDLIYMTSDGYVDQFGGDKGKKYKSINFKKLLLSIKVKPVDEQLTIIKQNFDQWKGDLEQLDDVCVIGFKA
jgi:serine phosphatase RsbU (regulator of sigma subunit)